VADELVIAQTVSDVSIWGIGRELGRPVIHDDGSGDGMFDVVFPDADPPVAMEVTAIVDGQFIATADAAQDAVERRLTTVALNSGHHLSWIFHLDAQASLKELIDEMIEIIGRGEAPPGRDIARGLNEVDVVAATMPEVRIGVWQNTASTGGLRGFRPELIRAIESKRTTLGRVKGHERHLAVDVVAMHASDPGQTPCPPLPAEIDVIWVTRRWYSAQRGSPVVWVSEGGPWRVNGAPHEAM
jgi:hypothetical protein